MSQVRRRQFLIATGALVVAPLAAGAQQARRLKRIGLLLTTTRTTALPYLKAYEEALRALGHVEGRDFVTEYRFAEYQRERLSELAAELVRLKVDVILTATDPVTIAAKQATGTIPIVMAIGGDPVGLGLIASLKRPGGNITGLVYTVDPEIFGKRLELLREIVPGVSRLGVLWHPELQGNEARWKATEEAARRLGMTLVAAAVRESHETEIAFTRITREGVHAAVVIGDAFALSPLREDIPALAAKSRLPTTYTAREAVVRGGLMSYTTSILDLYRRAAGYVDKILSGANPGELPVEQPMKFDLVINLKAARAIGLTIPQSILLRADEVIE